MPRELALLLWAGLAVAGAGAPRGGTSAVAALLDRVLPGSAPHFRFGLADSCPGAPASVGCYSLADDGDHVVVTATGASELAAAIGHYFREYCNMTVGWPRGGGSSLHLPDAWPKIGAPVTRSRSVPWSYMMNVCTHSYSLVWYDWADWERLIDWMALWGVNNVLALTGQEEVQYKVFQKFGLSDSEIRGWFNGPAFLTWSRGQNEYGSGIAGPLPRSWMKGQWLLQRQILARYRELGIVGQLPGFQGNVPVGLKAALSDANITAAGATGWMDSLDPAYAEVAGEWMRTLVEDFGTDHWYQLDGYFNGGTAPWLSGSRVGAAAAWAPARPAAGAASPGSGAEVPVDLGWFERGAAAFRGLNSTDPAAVWSFQGFAFEFWKEPRQASYLKGFVSAVPAGRLSIVDMDYGPGEWQKFSDWWNGSAPFFGAQFVWTALHNFGGTDGLKGDLRKVNAEPFAALEAGGNVWGTGFTGEGIDQNPAFYDFLLEQHWRSGPVPDIPHALAARALRRYAASGGGAGLAEAAEAWVLLGASMYADDVSVQDVTGVAHLPGTGARDFGADRRTPSREMCSTFEAWSKLVHAAPTLDVAQEPLRYDLVNLGRDVLARLSTPMSMNFSDALGQKLLDSKALLAAGTPYLELLGDLDELVGTDSAFLLGSWLAMARRFGRNSSDCHAPEMPKVVTCEQFYEWNARVQVTTWNPTRPGDAKVPDGPIDYAAKHWNGLIGTYYKERAARLLNLALAGAAAGRPLEQAAADRSKAALAYEWSVDFGTRHAEHPVGDAVQVSRRMLRKFSPFFEGCSPAAEAEGVLALV